MNGSARERMNISLLWVGLVWLRLGSRKLKGGGGGGVVEE